MVVMLMAMMIMAMIDMDLIEQGFIEQREKHLIKEVSIKMKMGNGKINSQEQLMIN